MLGYRSRGKLTFPLCRTDVKLQQQNSSTCLDAEIALTGTYCTPELLKAIEKGYQILRIYEVYHWKDPQFNQYERCHVQS